MIFLDENPGSVESDASTATAGLPFVLNGIGLLLVRPAIPRPWTCECDHFRFASSRESCPVNRPGKLANHDGRTCEWSSWGRGSRRAGWDDLKFRRLWMLSIVSMSSFWLPNCWAGFVSLSGAGNFWSNFSGRVRLFPPLIFNHTNTNRGGLKFD